MQQETEQLTITAEEANQMRKEHSDRIAKAKALKNLYLNEDFKKVFLEGYLKDEAVRLVGLLGEPNFNGSEKKDLYRAEIRECMIGIARFNEYCRQVFNMAQQSESMIKSLNEAEIVDAPVQ